MSFIYMSDKGRMTSRSSRDRLATIPKAPTVSAIASTYKNEQACSNIPAMDIGIQTFQEVIRQRSNAIHAKNNGIRNIIFSPTVVSRRMLKTDSRTKTPNSHSQAYDLV